MLWQFSSPDLKRLEASTSYLLEYCPLESLGLMYDSHSFWRDLMEKALRLHAGEKDLAEPGLHKREPFNCLCQCVSHVSEAVLDPPDSPTCQLNPIN